MKNPILKITLLLFLLLTLYNCTKECSHANTNATCNETVPTDQLCQAQFTRWFYNKGRSKCEQIEYTGCSASGFETEVECKECECN